MPRVLALLLLAVLSACAKKPPATAADLALSAQRYPALVRAEAVVTMVDDGSASAAALELRAAHLASAARFVYHLKGPPGGVVKAHLMLFVDEATARADWKTRHLPQSLAQTRILDAGDEAWIFGAQMASLRVGRAVIELRARGEYPPLAELAQASAVEARTVLRSR